MLEEPPCRHHLLAAGHVGRVSRCDCGTVHLALGALTLRLSERQLSELAETLEAAARAARREGEGEAARPLLC